jgi:hypothetical protein
VDPQANDAAFTALSDRKKARAEYIYQLEHRSWFKEKRDRELDHPHFFSLIHGSLSTESREKVEQAPNWVNINSSKDPLKLWLRVQETHQSGGEAAIKPFAKRRAMQLYVNVKQSATETITEYKRRFDDLVRAYTSQWGSTPDTEDQACVFSGGLDTHRYSVFELEMQNSVMAGMRVFPATLQAMYQLASEFKILSQTGKIVDAAIYTVNSTPDKRGKPKLPKPAPVQKPKLDQSSKPAGDPKPKRSAPNPCKFCGGDHWNKDCPVKPTAPPAEPPPAAAISPATTANRLVHFTRATISAVGIVLKTHVVDDSSSVDTIRLDNQADVSIFRDAHLLTDIRPAPAALEIRGIISGGQPLTSTQVGTFRDLCTVFYHADASANIISMADVDSTCSIEYCQDEKRFTLVSPGGDSYVFTRSGTNLSYLCVLTADHLDSATVLAATALVAVKDKERLYTQRQVQLAKEAQQLIRSLGYLEAS